MKKRVLAAIAVATLLGVAGDIPHRPQFTAVVPTTVPAFPAPAHKPEVARASTDGITLANLISTEMMVGAASQRLRAVPAAVIRAGGSLAVRIPVPGHKPVASAETAAGAHPDSSSDDPGDFFIHSPTPPQLIETS